MGDLQAIVNIGLGFIGYLFIMAKAGGWLASIFLKRWDRRRKLSAKQRAVNDLYDAFELEKIQQGTDLKITTKGNLVIMMYRKGAE